MGDLKGEEEIRRWAARGAYGRDYARQLLALLDEARAELAHWRKTHPECSEWHAEECKKDEED